MIQHVIEIHHMFFFMYAQIGLYDIGMIGEGFTFEVPEKMKLEIGDLCEVEVTGKPYCGLVMSISETFFGEYKAHMIQRKIEHPFGKLVGEDRVKLLLQIAKYYLSPFQKVVKLGIPEKIWLGTYKQKKVQVLLPKNVESAGGLKKLTGEQKGIVDSILSSEKRMSLIHAVTGAGKTEIYAHLATDMKKKGKTSLILVPEIALTPQLLGYFMNVFGDRIAVFHSKLSDGEKCQEWMRVRNGEVDIVIGSRSALFAPIQNIGLVVVDEEHEWTYKNEQHPRYYVHRVLDMMSDIYPELKVVYGSATPRVEMMFDALNGKETALYTLDQKIYEQTSL